MQCNGFHCISKNLVSDRRTGNISLPYIMKIWSVTKTRNRWIQFLVQKEIFFLPFLLWKVQQAQIKSHQDHIRLSYSPHVHFLVFSTCYHGTSWCRSYCQTCYVGTVSNKLFYKTVDNFYHLLNSVLLRGINFILPFNLNSFRKKAHFYDPYFFKKMINPI